MGLAGWLVRVHVSDELVVLTLRVVALHDHLVPRHDRRLNESAKSALSVLDAKRHVEVCAQIRRIIEYVGATRH